MIDLDRATDAQLIELEKLYCGNKPPKYLDWYRKTIPAAYVVPQHLEWLCSQVVQKVIDDPTWNRLILSMPPQHAKSDTITRRLPVYVGEHFPGENILITGYSQTFAETQLSSPARDLALERGVIGKATALSDWKFKSGGSVTVRGVGNPPTGVPRLKWVIIDDPISSREDAGSETIRTKIWEWYTGSIVQRFWPDTRVILIATRWHEDDLIGRLVIDQPDQWRRINLSAIADGPDDLGREEGQALWPALKPIEFLLTQKAEMGAYEFEALFQGHPSPREGSFFRLENTYQVVDVIPPVKKSARAWDIAHTEAKGDWTAGVKMASLEDGRYIVLDVRRERLDTDKRDALILETAKADGQHVRVRGPQDPGGKSWSKAFVRMLAGYNVHTEIASKAKDIRASAYSAQWNAGNVLLLRGSWNKDYLEELRTFPNGKNDDQVDASSDAFEDVVDAPIITGKVETVMPLAPSDPQGMPGTLDGQGRLRTPRNVQTFDMFSGLR